MSCVGIDIAKKLVLSQIQLLVDNLYRAPGSGRNYAASS
jgi:hypothetical protein